MPYRRPDSPIWWISFTNASGERTRESSGTQDREEAKALEGRKRAEVHRVARWGEPRPRTVDEVLLQYLRDTPDKKSGERDLYSAQRLQGAWTGRSVHTLTADDITSYKAMRKAATDRRGRSKPATDGTIARELGLLSAAIDHCNAEHDWNLPNPTAGRIPQPRRRAPRWLSPSEANALLDAAMRVPRAPHLVDFIELGLLTGMRSDEMLALTWSRVDFAHQLVYFDRDDQKSEIPGSIPLSPGAIAVLTRRRAWIRSHPATERNPHRDPETAWVFPSMKVPGARVTEIKNSWAAACELAGVRRATPHTLRHTFASWLVQRGKPLRTVCELCRHADIRTTMRYAHLAPHSGADAVAVLDEVLSRSRSGHANENGPAKEAVSR